MQMGGVEVRSPQSMTFPVKVRHQLTLLFASAGYKISFLLGPTDTREGESRGMTHYHFVSTGWRAGAPCWAPLAPPGVRGENRVPASTKGGNSAPHEESRSETHIE